MNITKIAFDEMKYRYENQDENKKEILDIYSNLPNIGKGSDKLLLSAENPYVEWYHNRKYYRGTMIVWQSEFNEFMKNWEKGKIKLSLATEEQKKNKITYWKFNSHE